MAGASAASVTTIIYMGGPSDYQNNSDHLNTNSEQYPHFKGGFGEYVYIQPDTFVWKIPEDMPCEIAALMDPVAVAMRAIEMAMTEMGTLQEGISTTTRALVIGAGPIGIIAGMILKQMGVEQLVISDQVQGKLEAAKRLSGADIAVNLSGLTDDERIQKMTELTNNNRTEGNSYV